MRLLTLSITRAVFLILPLDLVLKSARNRCIKNRYSTCSLDSIIRTISIFVILWMEVYIISDFFTCSSCIFCTLDAKFLLQRVPGSNEK